jgi:ATP-dependent protease HslVU (ClpYQ) peptidase subunit
VTAIACVVADGKVWMGGDSAVADGTSLTVSTSPKVFRVGALTIGWCGEARAGRAIQYGLSLSKQPRGVKVDEFITRTFVDALRKALLEAGVSEKLNNREGMAAELIVAFRGRIWTVDDAFAAIETAADYEGLGSGGEIVRGALGATPDLPPKKRITRALTLAERHDAYVRRPFLIVEPEP